LVETKTWKKFHFRPENTQKQRTDNKCKPLIIFHATVFIHAHIQTLRQIKIMNVHLFLT